MNKSKFKETDRYELITNRNFFINYIQIMAYYNNIISMNFSLNF
jgi:hypothetical protein